MTDRTGDILGALSTSAANAFDIQDADNIAVSLARSPEGRRDLEKGMHKALFLRAGFWDWMLERARNPPDGATP